jgi:hypothetical protein
MFLQIVSTDHDVTELLHLNHCFATAKPNLQYLGNRLKNDSWVSKRVRGLRFGILQGSLEISFNDHINNGSEPRVEVKTVQGFTSSKFEYLYEGLHNMPSCCWVVAESLVLWTDSLDRLKQTPWPLVRERTIPTERLPFVDTKFSADFCGQRGVAWSGRRIPYGH